ncbi:DUF7681 family protein [Enterovibrio nigricans]|nr:hypothetical protein [Enterovibrio nigricans]
MRLRRLMGVADQIVASRFSSIDLSNKAKAKLKTALRPLKATCHYLNKKKVYSMDNQHKKIKGYRDLTQAEIDDMNAIKAMGESLKEMVEKAKSQGDAVDQRWVSIAEDHLQQGIMAMVRSVAQPDSF